MPKTSREGGSLPEWKKALKATLDDAEQQAERAIAATEKLLDEHKRHRDEIRLQRNSMLGDDYIQPTQVHRDFIGKSLDDSILLVLDREEQALSLTDLYGKLREAGALLPYSSEARARDAINKSVEHWSTSPEQRRQRLARREAGLGKQLKQDPQTLKVTGDLVGRVDWPDGKFQRS